MLRIALLLSAFLLSAAQAAEISLPAGSAPQALEFPHFPSRMHAFVFRNWPAVGAERLAKVLDTTPENVRAAAESMGLPPAPTPIGGDLQRIYITLIRRNWHLLPYEQLLELLDMSAQQLEYCLREDDFLFVKLGSLKPQCEPLRYAPPTEEIKNRCAEIKRIVEKHFADALQAPEEPRFQFIHDLSQLQPISPSSKSIKRFSPRYIYSYFALYGDALMNPQLDPYPDGLLQKLSELGVDGVWLHTVLRNLAPSPFFPEFGQDCETRLKNLNDLVQRAKRFNIGVYLYVNEPRAMLQDFFVNHPELKGVQEGDYCAMCTSAPQVRQWLSDSLAYVFEHTPDLAGVFTITASENLTNCASHGGSSRCPRCKVRSPAEIIAEVNAAVESGVHRGNPAANVIMWDWGWNDEWANEAIAKLPKSAWLQSVSEWSKPIVRGGVETAVGEYSLSAVGPGPRASNHWAAAKKAGLKTIAKVQINATWELSAVPYLPVMDLIAEHGGNLLKANVDGLMLSWTVGGFPSPNLELLSQFDRDPAPDRETALNALAQVHFGVEGAPLARQAWTAFSRAFAEYPFHVNVVYQGPQQMGPANLLYAEPTHYAATMVGIPYDDVDRWRGPYPADVFAGQYSKIAAGWKEGLTALEKAAALAPSDQAASARDQIRFARAAQLHFASVANQTRFTVLRNSLLNKNKPLSEAERKSKRDEIKMIVQDEIVLAKNLFALARQDSRLGFEASNQYYYLPVDLMEKVIDCQYILDNVSRLYP
ncbi:MAG: hypothetical protein AB1656_03355 [Candidatus Omnitrophota bacterium]